jgi:hypothetical protein
MTLIKWQSFAEYILNNILKAISTKIIVWLQGAFFMVFCIHNDIRKFEPCVLCSFALFWIVHLHQSMSCSYL